MDVLRVDGVHYIWYARGKYPYSISLLPEYPVAIRDFTVTVPSKVLQKAGIGEIVKWEYLPLTVQKCIISVQEILMEEKQTTPY